MTLKNDRNLPVSLLASQVEAAMGLYHRCEGWLLTDEALDSLARSFPDFDLRLTLLKVAAVNALYATNVYAVARMAEHVEKLMQARGSFSPDANLVERLASPAGLKQKFYSFASKFAHFFIDAERFPIYDYYAGAMVTYHLGKAGHLNEKDHRYRLFAANFVRLKESVSFPVTTRELDRYLWLAVQYRSWKGLSPWRRPYTGINSELRRLFEASTEHVRTLLRALLGS